MPDTDAEPASDRLNRWVNILTGIAFLVLVLVTEWEHQADDPLSWVSKVKKQWEVHRAARRARLLEDLTVANFGLEVALWLDREVAKWASKRN